MPTPEELKSKAAGKEKDSSKGSSVVVNNITAKWNQEVVRPTLKDVSVRLKQGDLLAVIGPVGSGKVMLTEISTKTDNLTFFFCTELLPDEPPQ